MTGFNGLDGGGTVKSSRRSKLPNTQLGSFSFVNGRLCLKLRGGVDTVKKFIVNFAGHHEFFPVRCLSTFLFNNATLFLIRLFPISNLRHDGIMNWTL